MLWHTQKNHLNETVFLNLILYPPVNNFSVRAGEGISEPLSDILYSLLSYELFKHPATQIESLVLSCC